MAWGFHVSSSSKLRLFHVANHILALVGLYYFSPVWLLLSLAVWTVIGSLGISIGFHRLLSHRSFKTSSWFENTFAAIGCLATGGSPIAWVGAHRVHHRHVDSPRDPHAWLQIGKWRTYLHQWDSFVIPFSAVKDLLRNPWLRFMHRHYFTMIFIWAASLYTINPILGFFVYSWPAVLAFHAFGLINLFGHCHGYRSLPTADSSTNSWVANLLTCGEGWHNNHHGFPNLYRIGLRSNEWDISAWFLEKSGIMKDGERLRSQVQKARSQVAVSPVSSAVARPSVSVH